MTDYTDEEIDRLAHRVEERLRQKLAFHEMMAIRDEMRRTFDSMEAKLDRCIAIFTEAMSRSKDEAA